MSMGMTTTSRDDGCLEKNMADDGEKKEKKKQLGGLKTMPYILANEVCDRFATTGFNANMITYLTQQLNMPLVKASNTLTNFIGTATLTPLIGALAADSFAGQYWTIIVGSILYDLGLIGITVSAVLPILRPPPCETQDNCQEASAWQLSIFYSSLFLIAVGSGGIRPCVITFGADQFDMTKSNRKPPSCNFFNWYYFTMGLSTLLALTVVVYIQENVGWGWGLGIPTIAMAISIITFVIGSPLYKKLKPAGSPLKRLTQVIVAGIKKRNAVRPIDPHLLYENTEIDSAISTHGRLLHTNQFKLFDKAAIITEGDKLDSGPPNLWRIATVHRVEELKSIIRITPIWSAAILLATASSHQTSFSIQQARTMDRHLSKSNSFQIPPASMNIFNNLTMLIGLIAYERLFVPITRRLTGNPSGITSLQRMGIGFMINILSTMVAAIIEIKRKSIAANHNLLDKPKEIIPISVFWLVPQYGLHGLSEAFMSVGHLEFLYDQSPESLRSTAVALYWIAISMGNYLSTLLVSLVHKYSGKNNWLADRNINRGRLENYYWLVTCIQVLNFMYYILCAWFYKYKSLDIREMKDSSEPVNDVVDNGGDVELVKNQIPSKLANDVWDEEEGRVQLVRNERV